MLFNVYYLDTKRNKSGFIYIEAFTKEEALELFKQDYKEYELNQIELNIEGEK